ncbi:class I SAM-dependent methyltransferase [Planococcus liqunii]|uniref:Class I SAM-dependent methyltransferase n=1 Tax=Planococcus liqunii TaxID=3058394 RepID=A0ABT8MLZ5_9BACL|nr:MULTISPECIES: class I SAM-dependent methyltransferase [unclassified Planococcus (in: firmicutes)]MDN7225900.1 class I SAM-dependent methyltransferase [Planococcus sp. N064]WKA49691.1 class I SAM-dependent methyltransferase [Planococcus sp. N056]
MEFKGSSVYDQTDFLSNYLKRRGRQESPNNAIEKPIIFELLGDVSGKRILDLGCGDAAFGRELMAAGAVSYEGVEGSEAMALLAKETLKETSGTLFQGTMEEYPFPKGRFDVVTSRFAIHYIEDVETLFAKVYASLNEQGHFLFSVQHPLTTSSFESKQAGERRENWLVDDYFIQGERKEPWIDKIVVKHHRTIETYFTALTGAGFKVKALREGEPDRQSFTSEEEYQRRRRIPVMLVFSCEK